MLQVVAGRRAAALSAALALILSTAAQAQTAPPPEDAESPPLDPSAPLEPWDDLGVEWPDMEEAPEGEIPVAPDRSVADPASERTYGYAIEGLDAEAAAEARELLGRLRARRVVGVVVDEQPLPVAAGQPPQHRAGGVLQVLGDGQVETLRQLGEGGQDRRERVGPAGRGTDREDLHRPSGVDRCPRSRSRPRPPGSGVPGSGRPGRATNRT